MFIKLFKRSVIMNIYVYSFYYIIREDFLNNIIVVCFFFECDDKLNY